MDNLILSLSQSLREYDRTLQHTPQQYTPQQYTPHRTTQHKIEPIAEQPIIHKPPERAPAGLSSRKCVLPNTWQNSLCSGK